jgi:ubiquinone/menaquinone biosynthesis C-methylase UbiE
MTRLNARELALMDSPIRRWSQRTIELRTFLRLLERAGIDLRGGAVLDAGCGNGYGLELIERALRPRRLVGFDLMPEQVERARRRGLAATIAVGDITAIAAPDHTFDGVFVFGILHHVPSWRVALRELARVLKPGGVLLVEELHGEYIRWQDRIVGTQHPAAARFDWIAFRGGLADAGFTIAAETGFLFDAARAFAAINTGQPQSHRRDVC